MEESPLFNAGKGAVFTWEGKNELDASIMDGANRNAGAVAGVSRIRSPIEAAWHVMTNSPHVLLTGKGAEEFAESEGLEIVNPAYFYTDERYRQLLRVKADSGENQEERKGMSYLQGKHSENKYGTAGAVALDKQGNLAAGTSTGGMTNKRFGRIGDSPIIGAGTWADNQSCAVSATGHGEFFIRNVVAYDIAARMKYQGKDLVTASEDVISELKLKGGSGGVICLDAQGNIAMPFNTKGMYRGYIDKRGTVFIEFYGEKKAVSSYVGSD
jgi:beta-aspartyl-peptidase (threonine type)